MPLIPMSASPRAMLWSIDSNRTLTNSAGRPRPCANSSAISTSNPTSRSGWDGSASTNGAPPSGSPAQRSATEGAEKPEAAENARASDSAKAAKTNIDTTLRADTDVDSTRRRFDGDCRFSWNRAARQRHGRADAATGQHAGAVEPYGVEGARARSAWREGRGDARR